MANFYPANVPLVNYLFYNYTLTTPGPNLPLAGGFIFFRRDDDHTVEKPTYSDVSDPNDPVINENPLELNAVGAWPLFYAEEGLYYIVITGPDGDFDNPIWTLEHVNFAGSASEGKNIINYIPNGQFLLHNDIPATEDNDNNLGQISQPITNIAYGNWTFERPADSTAIDIVTFEEYTSWSATPEANPLWALRVQCTDPDSGDAYKDIRVKWPDVNRFAAATQEYTLSFSGVDNLANNVPVDLYLIKNFGTGGSTTTETLLKTFNLGPSIARRSYSFFFGSNAGKTIGPDGDDFVQLAIRARTNEALDVKMTNFLLQSGAISNPAYPETPQQQDVSAALGGGFPIPNPDGSDLYLQPRLTPNGWEFDHSKIGSVLQTMLMNAPAGYLPFDGTRYETAGYSSDGVPYARLQQVLYDEMHHTPLFGTGADYLTAYISGVVNDLRISTNTTGATTAAADVSTGFTISTSHVGDDYEFNASVVGEGLQQVYAFCADYGLATGPGAGTSGFSIALVRAGASALTQFVAIQPTVAAGLAGTYFLISTPATDYYVWFKVDGVGADPAIGGRTGILIYLLSTYDQQFVTQMIAQALSGNQITNITCGAASTLSPGDSFNIYTATGEFYVWYTIDGVGVDPAPPGKIGINVPLLGTDTAQQVVIRTQDVVNSKYFCVIDIQGLFIRALDLVGLNDPEYQFRWSNFGAHLGVYPGQTQNDELMGHIHGIVFENNTGVLRNIGPGNPLSAGTSGDIANNNVGASIQYEGTYESRPVNISFNFFIHY